MVKGNRGQPNMTLRFTIYDENVRRRHSFQHLGAYFQSRLDFVDIWTEQTVELRGVRGLMFT